jgi:SnoaL-like domain
MASGYAAATTRRSGVTGMRRLDGAARVGVACQRGMICVVGVGALARVRITHVKGERMATESDPGTSEALEVALSYFQAWTEHDFDRAMSFIAEDIVCDAPAGRIEGADAFRGFMGPFSQIVTRSELIGAFGDDDSALVMYGTDTVPVQDAPGAEYVTVRDGRIGYMRIIFDRVPFEAARRATS